MVIEELARYDFSSAANLTSNWAIIRRLNEDGNVEHKSRYIKRLCNGEIVGSFAQTEPDSGSDVASLRTSARLEDGYYVINGDKCFVTQAGEAEFTIVAARINDNKSKSAISMFLVEKDRPGYVLGQKEAKLGFRGSTTRSLALTIARFRFQTYWDKKEKVLNRH